MKKNQIPNDQLPINTWDQVRGGDVFIARAYVGARTSYFYGWRVLIKRRITHTLDNRELETFSAFGENDRGAAALKRAQEWAGEKYGIKRWKRNAMGDYINADAGYLPLRKRAK